MRIEGRTKIATAMVGAAVGLCWAGPAAADHAGVAHSAGDPQRGFELVSPPYKPSGIGVGATYQAPWSMTHSGTAAVAADRFAVKGQYGSTVIDGPFGLANDYAYAQRPSGEQGWRSHSPFTHPSVKREFTRFFNITSATPTLDRTIFAANGPLMLFEGMEGWPNISPRYVGDWGAPPAKTRWELLSVTDPAQVPNFTSPALGISRLSSDGSTALSTGIVHGMMGSGDPALPVWGDRLGGDSVYTFDLPDELLDRFPGTDNEGRYALVNACAGAGAERTRLPARLPGDLFGEVACPAPLAGRDERLVSPYGAAAEFRNTVVEGALSVDGRRAFFMAPDPVAGSAHPGRVTCTAETAEDSQCPAQVFVRQRDGDGSAAVRWLSRPVDGLLGVQDATLLGPAFFEGASADGDKAFFRTTTPLTIDDPNGVKDGGGGVVPAPAGGVKTGVDNEDSWDLYMYDLADDDDPTGAGSSLTRISGGPTGESDCNSPQGPLSSNLPTGSAQASMLRFVSDDGRRVYFACSGTIEGAVEPGEPGRATVPGGDHTSTDQVNLYLYDAALAQAQRWRFVARIPRAAGLFASASDVEFAPECASTGWRTETPMAGSSVGVTFNGAARSNCWSGTGDGAFVTFWTPGRLTVDDAADGVADVYGYDADSDELVRLSAPRGGVGGPYPCLPGSPQLCNGDGGFSESGAPPLAGVASEPTVAGSRVAFFQSRSGLVAGDDDGAYDVYQWRDGELSLVTTGASEPEDGAIYKGNDETGRNVYFATRDALTWQDVDVVADVYVARLGSDGIPEPPPPLLCGVLVDGCQGPGAPFAAPTVGETVQRGGGNASPGVRKRLRVGKPSRKARRRAARSGVIRLRIRSNKAGRVRVVVRGRVGKKVRRVGRASKRLSKPGATTVRIKLNRVARKQLRRGRRLNLLIQVRSPGARPRSVKVALRRTGR